MAETSYLYAVPYLVVFFILCYLYYRERKQDILAGRVAFVVLLLFIGLRGHVYSDYAAYYPFFEDLPTIFGWDLDLLEFENFEVGFVLYSSFVKTLFPNYFCWVFINALIDLLVFYHIFKRYSASVVLSFIALIAFMGLSIEFNLYRNSKALLFFLLSIPYLKERKILPYMLLNILGSFFHISSLLYVPMYFILTKHFPKILIWGAFIAVNILLFCQVSITSKLVELVTLLLGMERMSLKLTNYLLTAEEHGITLGYLERTFSFVLFALFYNRLIAGREYNKIFLNSFFFYYILLHLFSDVAVFATRIPLLFVFSYWLLFPNALSVIQKKGNRYILFSLFFMLCFLEVSRNNHIMKMYDNLLWGIVPYEERLVIFERYMN